MTKRDRYKTVAEPHFDEDSYRKDHFPVVAPWQKSTQLKAEEWDNTPVPEQVVDVPSEPTEQAAVVPTPRSEVLREAEQLITGDRNQTYGDPTENFQNIADQWTVQFRHLLKDGARFTPAHVAQGQILVKTSRMIAQPKRDNYVDIAGYAACGWEAESQS
jgi:hypothetical protein